MAKLLMNEVFEYIQDEREYQDNKWGSLEEKSQSIPGYLLVLEAELAEAKAGWMKNKDGRNSCLNEILQIAAVAVACLEQYGTHGNG